ncbi:MAG: NAD(P)-dependent oxidoreductase [Actinomycetota bacterium]|nr:NAD(P)-dependent oxidoreductase [Actinomycetota bacterium]
MNVLVTGGSGKLGRAVVADLRSHGHEVLNADLVPPAEDASLFVKVDLEDAGAVFELVGGIDFCPRPDAVVHLAAIPAPGHAANSVTFRANVVSSYNVFEAARRHRVKNVVYASTEIIFGLPFDTPPGPLPLTEDAAERPESAYGLAKLLVEKMAEQFCRWDPEQKMFGLRFSNVQEVRDYVRFLGFQEDPFERKWNLWGYIDVRDGARAVRKALESPLRGAEVFTIANAETVVAMTNEQLVARCFPGTPLDRSLAPNATLLSIDKARRLLGFEPAYSWRSEVDAVARHDGPT